MARQQLSLIADLGIKTPNEEELHEIAFRARRERFARLLADHRVEVERVLEQLSAAAAAGQFHCFLNIRNAQLVDPIVELLKEVPLEASVCSGSSLRRGQIRVSW